MYTGTGDGNTDIGAHLMGFLCGFAGGMLLIPFRERLDNPRWQSAAAVITIVLLIGSWSIAFQR
jgi:hypothetical protein